MRPQQRRPSRPSQRLIAGLLSAAIVLGAGYGPASAHPSTVHAEKEPTANAPAPADLTSTAGRIVWHLTSGREYRAAAEVPPGFVTMFGYRPQIQAGYPVDPAGGCSSPIALPQRFEVLCRSHDFGYDVLRFADRTGHRLGGWARLRLDRMLVERMRAACTSPLCQVAATTADLGLRLNTWRQFDGPPAPTESTAQIVTSGVGRGWAALHERGAR